MEGPLVSDTTEILSGAPAASEDAPAAAGATASTSKSRSRGGAGLSSLLMPELQRIAQTLAIPGAGRLMIDSIYGRDYPVVQGMTLALAVLVSLTFLATDIVQAALDPRIAR